MPDSWASVLFAGQVGSRSVTEYNIDGYPILAVDSAAEVLAAPAPGTSLVLVRADRTTTTLYTPPAVAVAAGGPARVVAGQLDSHWAVFALSLGGGQGEIRQLGVVDRTTGAVRVFRSLPIGNLDTVSAPVLFGGQVFWSEATSADLGDVYRYDPATGSTSTLARGQHAGNITALAGGLYWQNDGKVVTYRTGQLPAGFTFTLDKINTMFGDQGTYAWSTWAYGASTPVSVIRVSHDGMTNPLTAYAAPADGIVVLLAVTGPFVIWEDATNIVALDTRTGATTVLTTVNEFSTVQAAGGILALNYAGSKGGAQLQVIRAADLPELRC